MKVALENLFKSQDAERIPCTVVGSRGLGSYIVQDDLGRTFIASGQPGIKRLGKVVVRSGEIVGVGPGIKSIQRISV